MKYIRYAVLVLIALGLITVAMANGQVVNLKLLPSDLAALLGHDYSIEIPLFLVIYGGIAFGVLLGFIWEWMREHRFRSVAKTKSREVQRLEAELARSQVKAPKDEVLALLDAPKKV